MKHISELAQRVLTAIPLVSIGILSIFYLDNFSFLYGDTFFICLLGWEWAYLIGYVSYTARAAYITSLCLGFASIYYLPSQWVGCLTLVLTTILVSWVIVTFSHAQHTHYSESVLAVLGGLYYLLTWRALWSLKQTPFYFTLGLLIIVLTDTLAYFIGRYFGSHLLAPSISPNKTWEGLIAGIFGSVTILTIGMYLSGYSAYINHRMVIILIYTACIASLGDLFESAIKRQRSVKDSGLWLPGHGGLLDRFDSLVCALPVFSASLMLLL
jgi:phosphatidate cytidylyltransferase